MILKRSKAIVSAKEKDWFPSGTPGISGSYEKYMIYRKKII
jgi:hypothetical protein